MGWRAKKSRNYCVEFRIKRKIIKEGLSMFFLILRNWCNVRVSMQKHWMKIHPLHPRCWVSPGWESQCKILCKSRILQLSHRAAFATTKTTRKLWHRQHQGHTSFSQQQEKRTSFASITMHFLPQQYGFKKAIYAFDGQLNNNQCVFCISLICI